LAVQWLVDCAQAHKVTLLSVPKLPLAAYVERESFKLYLHDIGILGAMSGLDPRTLLDQTRLFQEFKGTLTEQYACQQLEYLADTRIYTTEPAYWTGATAEVDFVVQSNNQIIPIEVKAAWNLRAKSLASYIEKFKPGFAVRTALTDYLREERFTNIPLYALLHVFDGLES
jgi:predicted AAA+ superfamily ATPase